jgi:hypothetical protein
MSDQELAKGGAPLLGRLEIIAVIAVLGLVALAVGVLALVTPATKATTKRVSFTNVGEFSYSAAGMHGSVYGPAGLVTGNPIVVRSVGPVHVAFTDTLRSDAPALVHGVAGLAVKVQASGGFSRTFPLVARQKFTGTHVQVAGILPIAAISSYVQATAASLGGFGTPTATVNVAAMVKLSGSLHGQPLGSSFAPALPFTFNGSSLILAQAGSASDQSQSGALLKPTHSGSVTLHATAPGTVALPVLHPSRSGALAVGFVCFVCCLLLCLWIGRPLLRGGGVTNDRDRFRAMYGSMLVPVQEFAPRRGPVAAVSSMGALVEVAKRYESMIMHRQHEHGDDYMVWDSGMVYRYTIGEPASDEREGTEHPSIPARVLDDGGKLRRFVNA